MDPVTKSKEEMEKNAVKHFMDRDEKGRCIVKLSWIEAKEIVQDNRSVAEQRYIQTSQKLKEEGKYTAYEAVFKEWFDEELCLIYYSLFKNCVIARANRLLSMLGKVLCFGERQRFL
ncbi:hypothetical protein TNCT_301441 [Trichonephila clavata]|uniref:Uncharacterized protein n=1 Tax=Trichonephila clavata TaxID=2740835 RepID=A0A8X6LNQ5_TRICU|nr:hypothetical protein TNCT_301441 [Trichonephila clavata]